MRIPIQIDKNQNNAEALFRDGFALYNSGDMKKQEKAVVLFQKAADLGHLEAQKYLGYCLLITSSQLATTEAKAPTKEIQIESKSKSKSKKKRKSKLITETLSPKSVVTTTAITAEKAEAKGVIQADPATKIKNLPKDVRDFLQYFELDEEKGINEPQPLGKLMQNLMAPANNPMTPLSQVIEVYEKLQIGDQRAFRLIIDENERSAVSKKSPLVITTQVPTGQSKQISKMKSRKPGVVDVLDQFNIRQIKVPTSYCEVIRTLLQAGADPEMLYRNLKYDPKQNPLIRAMEMRRKEGEEGSLYSILLQDSSFDVNKTFFMYDGWNGYITPLGYLLGLNYDNSYEVGADMQRLLVHPDLEINTGQDLLKAILLENNSTIIQKLLDFGFNPNQTEFIDAKEVKLDTDELEYNYGTLLNMYSNERLTKAYTKAKDADSEGNLSQENLRSIKFIFNSGRDIDLSLTDKEGFTLLKRCAHISTRDAFLFELCISELKVQVLQLWINAQLAGKSKDQFFKQAYELIGRALGKPSQNTIYDLEHLHVAMRLDKKVVKPIFKIVASSSITQKISDIPNSAVRDALQSVGFKLDGEINREQTIKKDAFLSTIDKAIDKIFNVSYVAKDRPLIISPLEYAAFRGDKLLSQVLLSYPKVRKNKIIIGNALKFAISKINLNIIHIILSVHPFEDPVAVFEYALDGQHYLEPDRHFAVVRLLLEHEVINKAVPNRLLGKAFLQAKNNESLSVVLFRAIKQRIFKMQMPLDKPANLSKGISSFHDVSKLIADDFFEGNVKALERREWDYLIRAFNSQSTAKSKKIEDIGELKDTIETKEKNELKKAKEFQVENDEEQLTPDELSLLTQVYPEGTFNLVKSIHDCFDNMKEELTLFRKIDQQLLDRCHVAFRLSAQGFQDGLALLKQMNLKRVAIYFFKKSYFSKILNDSLLSLSFLNRIDNLNDNDKRLMGLINFYLAVHYLSKEDIKSMKKHLMHSESILFSIKHPEPADIEYQTYALLSQIRIITVYQEEAVTDLKRISLKYIEHCHSLSDIEVLPQIYAFEYLKTLNAIKGVQTTIEQLQTDLKIVALFNRIKNKSIRAKLDKSHPNVFRVALYTLIENYDSIPKQDWKIILDGYRLVFPDSVKLIKKINEIGHEEAGVQLHNLAQIISEISPEDKEQRAKFAGEALTYFNKIKRPTKWIQKLMSELNDMIKLLEGSITLIEEKELEKSTSPP